MDYPETLEVRLKEAIDLIEELRSYCAAWEWKYGKEWDTQIAAIKRDM